MTQKSLGHSQSSPKWKIHSNTDLPQETRKIPNKQPNDTPKVTRRRGTNET